MRNTKITYVLLAILVGATLVALAPTAQAQQSASVTVALNTPENVKPLQGPVSFSGTATLVSDYSSVTGVIGIPVTYSVTKQPAWATVLVSPATDVFPAPQPGGASTSYTASRSFTVTVTASDNAPAFQADQIEITASANNAQGGQPISPGKGQVPITATYFSIIDVQLTEAIKVERPQTPVIFPVKITNFGNANTKVTFDIGPGTSEQLQTPLPNPVTLQSKQAGGNQISSDVQLTIQTPYKNGYMNEVGIVNYKLTSAYALDPKLKGDESSVSVLVTTRGFYVPATSPLVFVGLIGALALALRRFR